MAGPGHRGPRARSTDHRLITAHAPRLLACHVVGPVTVAQLLATAGSNPDRLRGDAALAALCGASPGAGLVWKHHPAPAQPWRRPRGNNALWVIAHVRTISDPRTRTFGAKRTATGNSRKEIMRMLQRYIARELYPLIIDTLRASATIGLT